MLRALAEGETDPQALASLAQRRLKRKEAELVRALQGQLTEAQRWVLKELLDQYDQAEACMARVEERLNVGGGEQRRPFCP